MLIILCPSSASVPSCRHVCTCVCVCMRTCIHRAEGPGHTGFLSKLCLLAHVRAFTRCLTCPALGILRFVVGKDLILAEGSFPERFAVTRRWHTGGVCSTPEQGAWCRERWGGMEAWHCTLLSPTQHWHCRDGTGTASPHVTFQSSLRQPRAGLLLFHCPTMALPSCQHWWSYGCALSNCRTLILPNQPYQEKADRSYSSPCQDAVTQAVSQCKPPNGQSMLWFEVWDCGNFSLDEVKLPCNGTLASVFFSHPELFSSI